MSKVDYFGSLLSLASRTSLYFNYISSTMFVEILICVKIRDLAITYLGLIVSDQ